MWLAGVRPAAEAHFVRPMPDGRYMRSSRFFLALSASFVSVALARQAWLPRAPLATAVQTQQDACSQRAGPAPLISEDSIGFFDVHIGMDKLRKLCPSAHDTVIGLFEEDISGVVFHLHGLTAVFIYVDPFGSLWRVAGQSARLPDGLTLAARWGEVRRKYGPGIAHWQYGETVEFCRFPRLSLVLNLSERGDPGTTDNLRSIPDSTSIDHVLVWWQDQHLNSWGHNGTPLRPCASNPAGL